MSLKKSPSADTPSISAFEKDVPPVRSCTTCLVIFKTLRLSARSSFVHSASKVAHICSFEHPRALQGLAARGAQHNEPCCFRNFDTCRRSALLQLSPLTFFSELVFSARSHWKVWVSRRYLMPTISTQMHLASLKCVGCSAVRVLFRWLWVLRMVWPFFDGFSECGSP